MGSIIRAAVMLGLVAGLVLGLRDSGEQALRGNPEGAWATGVDHVDTVMSEEGAQDVNQSLTGSMSYAEAVGKDISDLTE
jgi:hypothetical protein